MHKNSELLLRMISQGFEIASHSYNHPNLKRIKDDEELLYQLNENQAILDKITNSTYEINLFRPPYGAYNDDILQASDDSFIMWSVDTLDWKNKDIDANYNAIIDNVKDGDIILLHDLYYVTAESVDKVAHELTKMGYQIVTVTEMMQAKNIELVAGEVYSSGR